MSRKKIFYFSITALCVLVLLFSSCKDNPTTPKTNTSYVFDTARYNWKIDTLGVTTFLTSTYNFFWVQDSSNIYFITQNGMMYYNGSGYNLFPTDNAFTPYCLGGFDRNNIYLGGMDNPQQNFGKPAIRKWNGGAFEQISISDTAHKNYLLTSCYIRSINEIWFGSNKGRILKYDGLSYFIFQDIDSNYAIENFYTDQYNNFYFFAYRDSMDIHWTSGKSWVDIYEYNSTQWAKVYSKEYIYTGSSTIHPVIPFQVGNEIVGGDDHGIYLFTNNNFNKVLQVDEFVMHYLVGNSLNNIMVFGDKEQPLPREANLFQWNGKRWSKEFTYHTNLSYGYLWIDPIQVISDKMFIGVDVVTYLPGTLVFIGHLRTN